MVPVWVVYVGVECFAMVSPSLIEECRSRTKRASGAAMYPDKAMRVTPRPMSNNKMETSPLIEECTIAEETSPAAGERMVACVEARGD